jgi:AcrR family transcriptional regulator
MAHKPRKEMIAETRAKLVAAARQAFGTVGYAQASMDDFTASAGLTRGALYHHFGDKKGLLEAVIAELDTEMTERMRVVAAKERDPWRRFVVECTVYVEMARDPEIRRIVHCDAPAVLGDPWQSAQQNGCIASMTECLTKLSEDGVIVEVDVEAVARLINGASLSAAQWIASSDDPAATTEKAVKALEALLEGLRVGK